MYILYISFSWCGTLKGDSDDELEQTFLHNNQNE